MTTAQPVFDSGTQFHLPELARRIPVCCHPRCQRIRQESNRWVRSRLGFALHNDSELDAFCACEYALWACLLFPALLEDRTLDISDWTQYFFVFDNVCSGAGQLARRKEGARELFAAIKAVMRGRPASLDNAYAAVFEELWLRIAPGMSLAQRERFERAVVCFVDGCFAEVSSRAAGQVLDYEAYMQIRRDSVGGKMYFILVEYGLRIDLTADLPGPLPGDGPLGGLIGLALDYLILTNDLFSFRAECAKSDYVNAVSAFMYHEGLSLQASVNKLCSVADRLEEEFLDQRERILAGTLGRRADVEAYVEALGNMMSGNLHWSYLTPRYHGQGHVWNGATSGTLTLHVDRTVFD